jgi:transcription initiation factor TFIIIB Brf1 subunit/transcription initiation factor TFIIB
MIDLLTKNCFRCSSGDIIYDKKCGDFICLVCGEILASRVIDDGAEWNIYADDDKGAGDGIRAEIGKKSLFGFETFLVGGSENARNGLKDTQNKLIGERYLKAMKSLDLIYSMGECLRISTSVQVSDFVYLYLHIFPPYHMI